MPRTIDVIGQLPVKCTEFYDAFVAPLLPYTRRLPAHVAQKRKRDTSVDAATQTSPPAKRQRRDNVFKEPIPGSVEDQLFGPFARFKAARARERARFLPPLALDSDSEAETSPATSPRVEQASRGVARKQTSSVVRRASRSVTNNKTSTSTFKLSQCSINRLADTSNYKASHRAANLKTSTSFKQASQSAARNTTSTIDQASQSAAKTTSAPINQASQRAASRKRKLITNDTTSAAENPAKRVRFACHPPPDINHSADEWKAIMEQYQTYRPTENDWDLLSDMSDSEDEVTEQELLQKARLEKATKKTAKFEAEKAEQAVVTGAQRTAQEKNNDILMNLLRKTYFSSTPSSQYSGQYASQYSSHFPNSNDLSSFVSADYDFAQQNNGIGPNRHAVQPPNTDVSSANISHVEQFANTSASTSINWKDNQQQQSPSYSPTAFDEEMANTEHQSINFDGESSLLANTQYSSDEDDDKDEDDDDDDDKEDQAEFSGEDQATAESSSDEPSEDETEHTVLSPEEAAKKQQFDRFITPLAADHDGKVDAVLNVTKLSKPAAKSVTGVNITRADIGTIIPGEGYYTDDPEGWLNDEIVNAFFANLVSALNDREGYTSGRNKAAPYACYQTAWYKSASEKGVEAIKRWSRRQGIQGAKILETEAIFLPVNAGSHWIIVCISGRQRKIMHYDSLDSGTSKRFRKSESYFKLAREWLAMELEGQYVADEWTEQDRQSAIQTNGSDCGVFTCLNGLAFALGFEDPKAQLGHHDIGHARRALIAMLLNGGFVGDFALA